MKKGGLLYCFAVSVLMLYGCANSKENEESHQPQTNTPTEEQTSQNNEEESQQDTTLMEFGKEFQPPHFQVEKFNVAKTTEGNLEITIDYVFDQELFEFLKSKPIEYYYVVHYPTQLAESTTVTESNIIKGETISDSTTQMNYSIQLNQDIPENFDIDSLVKEPVGFQLYVLDKNKDPEFIIDDIYHYSDSSSTVLLDLQ